MSKKRPPQNNEKNPHTKTIYQNKTKFGILLPSFLPDADSFFQFTAWKAIV